MRNAVGFATISWPFFLLFLFFIAFRTLQLGHRFPILGEFRTELILGVILSVAAVARLSSQQTETDWTPAYWGVALLLLMAVMCVFSVDRAHSLDVYVDHALKMAIVSWFMLAWLDSPVAMSWFLGTYLLSFLKMAEEGVLGVITGSLVWENQGVPRLNGPTPLYLHPNSFSGTQLGTVPYLVSIARRYSGRIRVIALIQVLGALVVVVSCASRTAYVALAGWLAYQIVRSKKIAKGIVGMVAVGVFASTFLPHAYVERFESIFTQKDKEWHSIDTRKQILDDAWTIFIDHPLGVGTSAFPTQRMITFGRNQDTHNLYLEILTNLGIQGFVVFSGFVLTMLLSLRETKRRCDELSARLVKSEEPIFSKATNNAKHCRQSELKSAVILTRLVAESTVGFLIIRLFLGLFGHDLYEPYWWLVLGFALSTRNVISRAESIANTDYPDLFPEKSRASKYARAAASI